MVSNEKYLKLRARMTLPVKESKYKIAWWLKIILIFTFPLWIIPFLITNFFIGLMMRNVMENFQRIGRSTNPNFDKIDLNTLSFYNRDMELQNSLQLMIDDSNWDMMEAQDMTITTYDNRLLSAFFINNHQSNKNHKWIIATHGWQQNRYSILYLVKHFYEQGYSIVTYDTRGHGSNNIHDAITFGNKEADDLYAVILSLNNYLAETDFKQPPNITLIGNSMGASTVLETISRFDTGKFGVKCAISDCGFDSFSHIIKIMGKQYFNLHWFWFYYGVKFFFRLKDKFNINSIDPINKLKYCSSIPVLFIHGNDDETVPATMSQKMYEEKINYEEETISELLIMPSAKHIRAVTTDYDTYCKTTLKFVNKWTNFKTEDKGD
ncbi:alpha/beta hydrolase [Spiroplasma endosymbiont of Amphimallon solstitiale]|uniref:alpha/beta hydrolase n=1 Tax=Spiroplasma endosymbiont of Amphimallon solstitiale TaxID=3066288 RepID=UPI00313EAA36